MEVKRRETDYYEIGGRRFLNMKEVKSGLGISRYAAKGLLTAGVLVRKLKPENDSQKMQSIDDTNRR